MLYIDKFGMAFKYYKKGEMYQISYKVMLQWKTFECVSFKPVCNIYPSAIRLMATDFSKEILQCLS